jgi:hypothetical protein
VRIEVYLEEYAAIAPLLTLKDFAIAITWTSGDGSKHMSCQKKKKRIIYLNILCLKDEKKHNKKILKGGGGAVGGGRKELRKVQRKRSMQCRVKKIEKDARKILWTSVDILKLEYRSISAKK